MTVCIRSDGNTLLRNGSPTDGAVDALAREDEAHGLTGEFGGCCGKNVMVPQGLAAEAAANVGEDT